MKGLVLTKEQKKHYFRESKRALELVFPLLVNYNGLLTQDKFDETVNSYIQTVSGELPDEELDTRINALIELVNDTKVELKAYSDSKDDKINLLITDMQNAIDAIEERLVTDGKTYTDNEIQKVKDWVIAREAENTPTDDEVNDALA